MESSKLESIFELGKKGANWYEIRKILEDNNGRLEDKYITWNNVGRKEGTQKILEKKNRNEKVTRARKDGEK